MKKTFIICALLLAPLTAAFATEPKPAPYAKIEDIPAPLARQLSQHNAKYEEQYLSQVLQPLRQNTKSKNAIEASDLEKEQQQNQNRGRNFTGETVMRHDRDFDGKVSAAEIAESMLAERRNNDWADDADASYGIRIKQQGDQMMARYDADKDGVITMKEAAEAGKTKYRSRHASRNKGQLAQLLALDPDKDGKLTVDELTLLARKSFRTADTDGDGMLSRKETQKISELGLAEPAYGEGCTAPAPAKGDKVILVSADSGGSLSPLKISGARGGDMTVVQVDIAKGEGKIYLVTASTGYVIWQLTGDTARVSRLLLYGQNDNETGKLMTGAAGLPADRVSYLKRTDVDEEMGGYVTCLPHISRGYLGGKAGKLREKQTDPALVRILGRKPDARAAFSQPFRIDITEDKAVAATMPEQEQPAPEGYDAATWKDFIAMNPGGVVMLKPEEVVTEQSLESRGQLPGLAGVAQLVKSGHLQREKDPRGAAMVVVTGGARQPLVVRGPDRPTVIQDEASGRQVRLVDDSIYRVVKAPDEYPRSHGGYAVRYLLGKDMEPPKDRPGCFMQEGEEDNCR